LQRPRRRPAVANELGGVDDEVFAYVAEAQVETTHWVSEDNFYDVFGGCG
jgi:hypothetical protein